jgi:hypothetical protein
LRNQKSDLFIYYETIKRELNKRLIYECRCDERLKTKTEGYTLLGYRKEKKSMTLRENV